MGRTQLAKQPQTKQDGAPRSKNASSGSGPDLTRRQAADYIADLLDELKFIADDAGLSFLAYLLAMAKEEAQTEKLRDD